MTIVKLDHPVLWNIKYFIDYLGCFNSWTGIF